MSPCWRKWMCGECRAARPPTQKCRRRDRIGTSPPGPLHSQFFFFARISNRIYGYKWDIEQNACTISKYLLTKYLWIIKVKSHNFAVGKPGGLYLRPVFQVDGTRHRKRSCHVPPDRTHWGHNITSETFLPKIRDPKLIMRKHWTAPNWGALYKYLSRSCKKEKRLRKCSRLESKETW